MAPFHKELSTGLPENWPLEGHTDVLIPNRNKPQESMVSGKKHGWRDPKARKNIFLFKPKIIKSTLYLHNERFQAVIYDPEREELSSHNKWSLKGTPGSLSQLTV